MPYTKEQAEKDREQMLAQALEHERTGDPVLAGVFRAEAENCLHRVGMKKAHRPSLGPYTEAHPMTCLDCGRFRVEPEWVNECVVRDTSN